MCDCQKKQKVQKPKKECKKECKKNCHKPKCYNPCEVFYGNTTPIGGYNLITGKVQCGCYCENSNPFGYLPGSSSQYQGYQRTTGPAAWASIVGLGPVSTDPPGL